VLAIQGQEDAREASPTRQARACGSSAAVPSNGMSAILSHSAAKVACILPSSSMASTSGSNAEPSPKNSRDTS
jgi:hypothetical protein